MLAVKTCWRRPRMLTRAGWGALILLIVLQVVQIGTLVTDRPNTNDSVQNVQTALTLATTGSFASAPGSPPWMYREPLPIFVLAAHMVVDPRFSSSGDLTQLEREPGVIALKHHNLAWAFVLLLGVPFLVRGFIRNGPVWFVCSAAGIVLTTLFFLENPRLIDRNPTDLQAATLLLWSAVAAQRAIETRKIRHFLILGLLAGGLALTKAVFFYIVWVYFALLLLLMLFGSPRFSVRQGATGVVVAMLAAAAVITPWSVRNYVHFGTFSVAERGGVILWMRAVKNQMNDEEWRGAFYFYAPSPVSDWLRGPLGISRDALEAEGALRRLNRRATSSFAESDRAAEAAGLPEDAVSFLRAARAERVRLRREYQAQGYPNASVLADETLQSQALAEIAANPISHLRATPVIFWRGMWPITSQRLPPVIDAFASVLGMAAIWGVALAGLVARRPAVFGAAGLGVGMIAFYALITHGIPRYTWPATPLMMVVLSVVGGWAALAAAPAAARIWSWLKGRVASFRARVAGRAGIG